MNRLRRLRRVQLLALIAMLTFAAHGAGGAPVGQVSDFATPTATSGPEGIVAGPDGNLWFAEFNADKVAEVNPTTHAIKEFPTLTAMSRPLGIVLGPDGNIWFTEWGMSQIGEINPTTHAISEFPIPTASSFPVAIVAGPDGNLWFTESGANKIAKINPSTHTITEFPVPTLNSVPFGITAGPDGNIWFTEQNVSKIGVFNLTTQAVTEIATPTAASAPSAITSGPDGSVWFTESATAVGKIGLINPTTHTTMDFPIPTASSAPTVITTGPDGNLWFTENAVNQLAVMNPVTHAVTEFTIPTATSKPVGIATSADGNLWFTENSGAKVGSIGAGAPGPLATPPTVVGADQPGNQLTCQGATWSTWAAQQPSPSAYGFDGYRWLRNGKPIGDASTSYTVAATDVGNQISCAETVTYPLVAVTTSASSAPVTVYPSLGASLTSTSTSGPTVSLTISCQGLPSQSCSGTEALTAHVTTQGSNTIAVSSRAKKKKPKPKPLPKVTKAETIAGGSYSTGTGKSVTVTLSLNSSGQKLLDQFYKLPATLTISGTASAQRTVTFSYGRLHISPSYTWAFGKSFSYATELTLTGLPSNASVALLCHGNGCPFSKRTYSAPKHGKLALAPALKQRHLSPHATVELDITAPNDIGEVVIFTINSGKQPTETFRCLPPGAHRPTACARG